MSFADLKRKSQNNFSFLQKELEKSSSGKNVDDRFWKPEVDASGNGYAVIRFLPAPDGETIPWAKVYSHAFQGPGGWYIENSLTTLNEKDPVGEVNRRLWNSGSDEDIGLPRIVLDLVCVMPYHLVIITGKGAGVNPLPLVVASCVELGQGVLETSLQWSCQEWHLT